MSNLARTLVMTTFALGLSATAAAQTATSVTTAQASQESTQATHTDLRADTARSADKNCIRNTGTHIRHKAGQCLPVAGRSYSGKELRATGQIDTGRALLMLDPSVSLGH